MLSTTVRDGTLGGITGILTTVKCHTLLPWKASGTLLTGIGRGEYERSPGPLLTQGFTLYNVVTGTGSWVSQVPVETWYNEQLEIVGGDGNTIEQKRLVMLWNCLL